MKREFRRLVSRPLYLFCMVIAPLFCYIFFTTLMDSGLPTNMPVGVVDQDMTATSRQLVRNLDAFEQTAVVAHYPNIADARIAMQKGEIYGFYYIPEGTSAKAQAQRQPKVSFYTTLRQKNSPASNSSRFGKMLVFHKDKRYHIFSKV